MASFLGTEILFEKFHEELKIVEFLKLEPFNLPLMSNLEFNEKKYKN